MTEFKGKKFQGVTTALITPFTDNNTFDHAAMERLIDAQLDSGIHGLLTTGSTGEGFLLTPEERIEVLECVVQKVDGRVPIMASVSGFSAQEVVNNTMKAQSTGADAILVCAPPYLKPQQRALFEFFKEIHNATQIDIFIYDHPTRTGSTLGETTLKELMHLPRIKGIKDATNNMDKLKLLKRDAPEDFLILSGNDDNLWSYYNLGGDGIISASANFAAQLYVEHFNCHQNNPNSSSYKQLTEATEQVAAFAFIEQNPVAVKQSLAFMNVCNARTRKPYIEMSEENKNYLKQALAQFGLLAPNSPVKFNERQYG